MEINDLPYSVKLETIPTKPGCWEMLKVSIFHNDTQIGEYTRNYHALYRTFHPFVQNGQHYALYSKDYTATRVMRLPSCEDIAGEERNTWGFCPTGFAVPKYDEESGLVGTFGFVCGCIWGDDSSWKIQYLDLSRIEDGILNRDDRFGYIELLGSHANFKDAINTEWFYCPNGMDDKEAEPLIRIAHAKSFDLRKTNA